MTAAVGPWHRWRTFCDAYQGADPVAGAGPFDETALYPWQIRTLAVDEDDVHTETEWRPLGRVAGGSV